jgi:3-hydroxy-D-aspartate aldolase
VDVGQNRCGVATIEEVLELAGAVHAHASLRFEGIQCYQGAAQHIRTTEGRATVGENASGGFSRDQPLTHD